METITWAFYLTKNALFLETFKLRRQNDCETLSPEGLSTFSDYSSERCGNTLYAHVQKYDPLIAHVCYMLTHRARHTPSLFHPREVGWYLHF